jgi:uncharacterized protein (DUF305 family)
MRSTRIRVAAVLAALMTAAFLSSCSGSSSSSDQHAGHTSSTVAHAQPTDHNADDIAFAQNMIPHHEQAVEMAAMAPSHTANPDVLRLAGSIKADQQPEIDGFKALLAQWGAPVGPDSAGHAGHGGMAMDGMVDQATMNKLTSLQGGEFDTLWMESMISHHQGAVTMAQAELAHGKNPDAVKMAKLIVTAQQREIDYMNHLLGQSE